MRRLLLVSLAVGLGMLGAPVALAMPSARPVPKPLPSPVACDDCWHPELVTSWQWQLQFEIDQSYDVQMYDIDGFDNDQSVIDALHAAGRKVVCYISAGSWEGWRPDADRFPESVLGRSNGWPGERWLDIRKLGILRPIMEDRMDMCADKGFDAIEFDNVDGYQNRTGLPLTAADQLRFNVFFANQAHRRGLSAALKNDLGQVDELLPYFDFALNEQCFQFDECERLLPFVEAGKAVFGVEYKLETSAFCDRANAMNFNFLRKHLPLGAWRDPCR